MSLSFFGRILPLSITIAGVPQNRSLSAAAVLEANMAQLQPLAAQLDAARKANTFDDYGVLRLSIAAVDALGVRTLGGGRLLTVQGALARGEWNPLARMTAVAALLRLLGYNAVSFTASRRGGGLLGIPLGDPLDALSVTRQGFTQTTTRGRQRTVTEKHWTFWDGENPIGQGSPGARPIIPTAELFSGPQDTMRLLEQTPPAWVRGQVDPDHIAVDGLPNGIRYRRYPDLAEYLSLMPQRTFPRQVQQAHRELAEMHMDDDFVALRAAIPDEVTRINALLRAIQQHFTYKIGPLRSMHVIFGDRHGDCDQLSVLMAAALLHMGYDRDDLRTMKWSNHLCLAVRPRSEPPPGAVSVSVPNKGRFVALDSTYYVRKNGALVTQWGQLDDRYRRQRFEVGPVA